MPSSLKVPDSGLILESSAASGNPVPPQAFAITLSDHVLEDMIRCVQGGEDLQLSLGSSPTLLYGTSSHTLSPLPDSSYDLFLTKPFESTKRATRLPQTSSLWKKLPGSEPPKKAERAKAKGAPSTSSSGMDSDIENLQNSIAAATASKKQSQVMDRLPPANKKAAPKAKSKLLSSMVSYGNGGGKSSPSSPALVAVSSPSTNPVLSSSQQVVEKFKEQRSMIVHELAVQERPHDYLESLWEGKEEDFKPALEKVAQFESDTQKWALRKNYWRELDVWKYDYDTQDTRQKAIDNAIRQFDKMRLATTEPEWQKLLPREERGKGKILSKLQANIAKASSAAPPPKIKVQKADEAASDGGEEDVLKSKGETMSRSSSNSLPAKPKKAVDNKRLLPTAKKAGPPKAAASKSKEKAPAASKNGRVLSAEFVTNSDSDSESSEDKPMATVAAAKPRPAPAPAPAPKKRPDPAPKSKPESTPKPKIAVPKPRPKPVEKPMEQPVERSIERPKERSVEREPARAVKSQPPKRSREEEADDSSSSSGAPLAKRAKPKAPIKAPIKAPVSLKQRPADVSHASSRNSSGVSFKSKNTSPAKSSPLASSPPTNASDLEHSAPKKRKAMETSDSSSIDSARAKAPLKRQRGLSPELVSKAARFKMFYAKYAALHYEIADMRNPPQEKMADLLDMRERLKVMKTEIYRECPPPIAVA